MIKYFKQPNGKFCSFSWNGVSGFDLTEDDIKRIFVEQAEIEAEETIKNAENFGGIIKELLMRKSANCDDFLKQIGFTEPYKELVKYVPQKPTNQVYASCDFATYAKCPCCGETVTDSIGGKQEQCRCGQRLKWD